MILLTVITPNDTNAFNIHKENANANTIIEGYRTPAAMLTESSVILAANSLMKTLINETAQLYTDNGMLRFTNSKKDQVFANDILNVSKQFNNIKLASSNNAIDVNENIRLHYKSINNKVLVFALNTHYRKQVSKNTLMEIFQLTPAEAAICEHLLEGKELKKIASIENKSVNTVREQLHQSFRKTGCHSQTALINMLASIPVV